MQFFMLFIRQNQPIPAIAQPATTGGSPLPTQPAADPGVTLSYGPQELLRESNPDDTRRLLNRLEARLATPAKPAKHPGRLWNRLAPQGPGPSHPERSA